MTGTTRHLTKSIRKWQDNQMESSWTHVNHEVIELEKWTKRKWNDIAVEWRIDDPSFKNSTLSINLLRHPVYHHQEEDGVTKWSQLSLISYPDHTVSKYHSISGIPLTTLCTFASSKIVFQITMLIYHRRTTRKFLTHGSKIFIILSFVSPPHPLEEEKIHKKDVELLWDVELVCFTAVEIQ